MLQWVYTLLFLVAIRFFGFLMGRVARWYGFASVDTFFAHRGAYTRISCFALIFTGALCFVAATILSTPAGVALLSAVAGLIFIWGVLCGIDSSDYQAVDGSSQSDQNKLA